MIANPSKFHAILFSKNCSLTDRIPIKIKENLIESETQVDLLGLKIANRLSFKSHINAICKKAAKQLNALKRLGSFLNISQCKVLAQSIIMTNFNYCPAVWHFCSAKDKHKVEKIQERTLRFVCSDYCSCHSELLDKAETCTLELRQIHFICTEIYKTINNIGPEHVNSLVVPNQSHYSSRRPLNLFVPRINQTTYGLVSGVFATKVPYFGIAYRKK